MEPVRIGPCELWLGDCLEVIPALGEAVIDAVITDPPYFLPAAHYQTRKQFARSLSDVGIIEHWLRTLFGLLATASTGAATWYVFCDGQSYPAMYVTAYEHVKKLAPLVWDKMVAFNGYGWRHQHELILWCEREDVKPIPTGDGDILRYRAVPVDDRDHGAEKPVDLICELIQKSVSETAVVLDPCLGSGTTLAACIQTGRHGIGIEREPRYFDIACRRIELEWQRKKSELPFDPPPVETQPVLFGAEP